MDQRTTFLVFGATGGTGRHFVDQALARGDVVRAVVRTPGTLPEHPDLEVRQGTVPGLPDLDALLAGVDAVAVMLGDAAQQRTRKVNTEFTRELVPAMRRHGVRRLLYQAGGLSAAPGRRLAPELRVIRATLARGYTGQHEDNEAVMRYLAEDAADIAWTVHRAGIGSDGPSRGVLRRSEGKYSVATFRDVASHNHRLLVDPAAIHTCDLSTYRAE